MDSNYKYAQGNARGPCVSIRNASKHSGKMSAHAPQICCGLGDSSVDANHPSSADEADTSFSS